MPIRPELRHLYRGPEYRERRERIRQRAGDGCEFCGVRNHETVERFKGWWRDRFRWRDHMGKVKGALHLVPDRKVKIVCTLAHLDNNPEHNDDSNLRWLCQWCHLTHDVPHHARTRATRKDAKRPLLNVA